MLLIDADEGVQEQSRRHGYLLHLLGVKQVAVLVNKMDLVGSSADRFGQVAEDDPRLPARARRRSPACIVPISAREGDNIAEPQSERMPWYQGPTVVEALDGFKLSSLRGRAAAAHAGAGRLQVRPAPDHRRPDRERAGSRSATQLHLLAVEQDGEGRQHRGAGTCREQPRSPRRRAVDRHHARPSRSSSSAARSSAIVEQRRSRATCSRRGCSGSATTR